MVTDFGDRMYFLEMLLISGGRVAEKSAVWCSDGTPLANLWLTQAQLMGLKQDRFAESTGVLKELLK